MTSVNILPNRTRTSIQDGSELPLLIQTENPSSITLLIDSSDRVYGSDGNFRVNLNYNIPRPRYLQLKRMVVPKLPNVTSLNNTIQINHDLGYTSSFTIPVGMYNTTSMSNALVSAINAAFAATPIADTVTVTYSQLSRNFTITSVGGYKWYFDSACSFITRGQSLCGFSGGSGVPAITGSITQVSGVAGMLYTRYLVVCSDTICQYAYASSVLSSVKQPRNVIGVVDLAGMYDVYDFDVSVPYSGIYKNIEVNGPVLCQISSERSLRSEIDFEIYDSYGSSLSESLSSIGVNTLGLSLIIAISL